jgi:lysosomal acid phosphatase
MRLVALTLLGALVLAAERVRGAEEVVFAMVLHRHGDRSPTACIPNDAACAAHWPEGYGELSAQGMTQAHALGVQLRTRYVDTGLIRGNFTRRDVAVRSTQYDRTLDTAQSVVQGLYPPGTGPTLPASYGVGPALTSAQLQVIPINTVALSEDWLLRGWTDATCPNFDEAQAAEQKKDAAAWAAQQRNLDAIRTPFAAAIGLEASSLEISSLFVWTDALLCYRDHAFAWPGGMTDDLYYAANNISEFTMTNMFSTQQLQRLTGGPLVDEWTNRLEAAIAGTPQPYWSPSSFAPGDTTPGTVTGPRLYLYSAHDSTIVSILETLGDYNGVHPPYASSVVVELVNSTTSGLFVRVWYNMGTAAGDFWVTPVVPRACSKATKTCTWQQWQDSVASVRLPLADAPLACGSVQPTPKPQPASTKWTSTQVGSVAGSGVGGVLLGALVAYFLTTRSQLTAFAANRHESKGLLSDHA